jgi:hypothetical protein
VINGDQCSDHPLSLIVKFPRGNSRSDPLIPKYLGSFVIPLTALEVPQEGII